MPPNSFNPQPSAGADQMPGVTISPVIVPPVPLAEPTASAYDVSQTEPAMPITQVESAAVAAPAFSPIFAPAAAPNMITNVPMASDLPATQQFQAPAAVAPAVGKQKKALIITAVATALVMFTVGYLANTGITKMAQSHASTQARSFITALNSGDNAKAYSLTTKNLRSQQTLSQFNANMGNLKTSNPTFDQQDISFAGNQANYHVSEDGLPTAEDGSTDGNFTITLVRQGLTGWKIDSASVD